MKQVRERLRRGEEEKAERLRNHPGIKALEAWQQEKDEAERLERERREQERRERREKGSEAQTARLGEEAGGQRSEEDTSELQSRQYFVCRLLLEKKKRTR